GHGLSERHREHDAGKGSRPAARQGQRGGQSRTPGWSAHHLRGRALSRRLSRGKSAKSPLRRPQGIGPSARGIPGGGGSSASRASAGGRGGDQAGGGRVLEN